MTLVMTTVTGKRYTGLRVGSVRRSLPRAGLVAVRPAGVGTARAQAGELILFRRLVRNLIEAPPRDRVTPFRCVVEHVRQSPEPIRCVNVLLEELANDSGQDGLDLGVDVLSELGSVATTAAEQFALADARARTRLMPHPESNPRMPVHDDVWYMLVRGAARAKVSWLKRLFAISPARAHPSVAVRVSWVEAMGDLGLSLSNVIARRAVLGRLARVSIGETDTHVIAARKQVIAALGE